MGYAPIADPVVHGAARHLQILADSMGLNHISSPPMSGTASRHIKESSLVFSSLGITLSPVGALFYIVAYHLSVQPLSGVGNALRTGFMMLRSSPQVHKGYDSVRFYRVRSTQFFQMAWVARWTVGHSLGHADGVEMFEGKARFGRWSHEKAHSGRDSHTCCQRLKQYAGGDSRASLTLRQASPHLDMQLTFCMMQPPETIPRNQTRRKRATLAKLWLLTLDP